MAFRIFDETADRDEKMTKRTVLAAMIGILSLAMGPVLGCSEDDPSENDNQNQNTNQQEDVGTEDVNGNGDPDVNGENGDPDVNGNGDPDVNGDECQGNLDCEDHEVCDDGECVDAPYDCELQDWYFGQIGDHDQDSVPGSGGSATTEAFEESTGLQDVLDAIEDELEEYTSDEISEDVLDIEFDEPIEVEDATVTAVGYILDAFYWFGDADTGLYFRAEEGDGVPEEARVGDLVSFTVEGATVFRGTPQVSQYSDWTVGESDQEVSYIELGDDELDIDAHYNRIVRVGGQLIGNSFDCGSYNCFNMVYGSEGQHETVFRSASDFDEPGECITFIGPITSFPGVYTEDPGAQVSPADAPNFGGAWYWAD